MLANDERSSRFEKKPCLSSILFARVMCVMSVLCLGAGAEIDIGCTYDFRCQWSFGEHQMRMSVGDVDV